MHRHCLLKRVAEKNIEEGIQRRDDEKEVSSYWMILMKQQGRDRKIVKVLLILLFLSM